MKLVNSNRITSVILFFVTAFCLKVGAIPVLSNSGDEWISRGSGDIQGLLPGRNPYGADTLHFATGATGMYALDSITPELEFSTADQAGLASPQRVNASGDSLVGGEYLKLRVDATAVSDEASTAFLLSAGFVFVVWGERKFARKSRSKRVD